MTNGTRWWWQRSVYYDGRAMTMTRMWLASRPPSVCTGRQAVNCAVGSEDTARGEESARGMRKRACQARDSDPKPAPSPNAIRSRRTGTWRHVSARRGNVAARGNVRAASTTSRSARSSGEGVGALGREGAAEDVQQPVPGRTLRQKAWANASESVRSQASSASSATSGAGSSTRDSGLAM